MMRRLLFRSVVIVAALSASNLVFAAEAKAPPDLTGTWRFDAAHSDQPQRPGGGGREGGGRWGGGRGGWGGWGGRGGHGGRRWGGGGGAESRGGGQADGGQSSMRPARLPDFIHITETAAVVSFEDSSGTVLREIATVPAEADTFLRAPGALHVSGTWNKDALVVTRTGPRDAKITETISLKDKGKTLVIDTKFEASGDRPSREFKRVYTKVTQT